MGKSHALRPLLCWKKIAGWVYCDECYTCRPTTWGLLNPQPICNLTGESSAIHDCSVADMPQIKKWGEGGGWGTMFNQNWEKKEKFFLSKFQKFSPASKTRNKQTKKWGTITVFLLTLFVCRVIMILSIPVSETMGTGMGTSPACQESQVPVRDQVRGYRYKLPYPDKYHDYGYG